MVRFFTKVSSLIALALVLCNGILSAQGGQVTVIKATDEAMPLRVFGMSYDGKYITGFVGLYQRHSFVWSKEGGLDEFDKLNAYGSEAMSVAENGYASGMFSDFNYIYTDYDGTERPMYAGGFWNGNKWVSLGLKEGLSAGEGSGSTAEAISSDGAKLGGARRLFDDSDDLYAPTIWTVVDGDQITAQELEFELKGQGARIFGMSGDASVAGGWAGPYLTRNAVVWKDGQMIQIKHNGLILEGEVRGISENGKYAALQIVVSDQPTAAIYDIDKDLLTFVDTQIEGAEVLSNALAVSNTGIAVGYNRNGAFIYSEQLGTLVLEDYLISLGIEIPSGVDFQTPTGISGNGLKIAGHSFEYAWYIEIDKHLTGLYPARDLRVVEESYGNIKLSWLAPTDNPNSSFLGYKVYRDGVNIATIPVNTNSYTDASLENGHYKYTIKTLWNAGAESLPTAEVGINTARLGLPFFDDFSSNSLEFNYWNNSNHNRFSVNMAVGILEPCLNYRLPTGNVYSEHITSALIDASTASDLRLAYSIAIPFAFVNVDDVNLHKFIVEIHDGNDWNLVTEYRPLASGGSAFQYKEHDISAIGVGKEIRLRFRAEGDDRGSFLSWMIDNVRIYESAGEFVESEPTHLSVHKTASGKVRLNWADSKEAANLSYLPGLDSWASIGNEGKPFIAANLFDAQDIKKYDGFKLLSISAMLTAADGSTEHAKHRLVAFQGADKVLDQDIETYDWSNWNTFILENPIIIDGSRPLYFGIEVVAHSNDNRPIGLCEGDLEIVNGDYDNPININDGKSNLFSEDNGVTWKKLTDYNMNQSLAITATIAKDENAPSKEGLLGYKLYRNGVSLLGEIFEGNDYLSTLNNYTDLNPQGDDDCYQVSAFYYIRQRESNKVEDCLESTSSIDQTKVEDVFKIYPNPASEYISIEGEFEYITIFDANGVRVLQSTKNTIDISSLPAGVYLLKINSASGESQVRRIVKQ